MTSNGEAVVTDTLTAERLEELERLAREVTRWIGKGDGYAYSRALLDFEDAVDPATVLALIARIRELERRAAGEYICGCGLRVSPHVCQTRWTDNDAPF